MRTQSIEVDVVGAAMVARAHLGGCRAASTVPDTGLPDFGPVARDDAQKALARDTAVKLADEDHGLDKIGVLRPAAVDLQAPPPVSEAGRTGFGLLSHPVPRP